MEKYRELTEAAIKSGEFDGAMASDRRPAKLTPAPKIERPLIPHKMRDWFPGSQDFHFGGSSDFAP